MNRNLAKRRLLQISIGALVGLTISTLVLYPSVRDERLRTLEEEMGFLLTPLATPDFTLTSHTGEPFSSDALRGRFSFIFFGFTNCPDVCPVTLMNLTRALDMMPEGAEQVQGVLVSVDPERDTPERLAEYLGAFDPGFVALTGSENDIRAVASGFGVFFAKGQDQGPADDGTAAPGAVSAHAGHAAEGAGNAAEGAEGAMGGAGDTAGGAAAAAAAMTTVEIGGYTVDHTARSYVLDREGQVVLTLPPFATAEQIARALSHLLAAS